MQLTCFYCGNVLRATADQLGGEVVCPHCHKVVRLPEAEALASDQPHQEGALFHSWLNDGISGFVSFIIHAGLLILFASVTCNFQSSTTGDGVDVMIGDMPEVSLDDSGGETLDTVAAASEVTEAVEMDELLNEVAPPSAEPTDIGELIDTAALTPSGAMGGGIGSLSTVGGGGSGVGAGASFMGLRAAGRRFCIIADCSGSMSGAKLDYVKEEILETVGSLPRDAQFQVVFFQSQAVPFPQTGWRHPKRDFNALSEWLKTVGPQGGTNPEPAFEIAMGYSQRPDAIFFMTDGMFDANVVDQVRRLNSQGNAKVKIHAISFMDRTAEPLMRKIAGDSGGEYRHVQAF
ncbi:vWA domain-containing protein [Blastopirellula retiformator]|uniref:von Willebrand factor type A domain protein n=1 Tax=Blastopirellula retiformator TaxID=2527970 RepID=A0A5C5VPL6_9BACT|nr:vWA domain-containing protein [Blastopirellula retiformator]TWT39649.1 von Willebrand factor type A domain protein [Blastopirellula retiformator]